MSYDLLFYEAFVLISFELFILIFTQGAATCTSPCALPNMFLFWEVIDAWSANTQIALYQFFQIWGLWVSCMDPHDYEPV
jgi:hypothetical protein